MCGKVHFRAFSLERKPVIGIPFNRGLQHCKEIMDFPYSQWKGGWLDFSSFFVQLSSVIYIGDPLVR